MGQTRTLRQNRTMTNHSTPPAGAEPGAPAPQDPTTRFFDWWRSTGLRRSADSWLGGVAGGVATRLGLDPMIVRGALIVIAILGGPVLFVYAAGWALIPDQQGRIHLERAIRGVFDPAIVAIGILAVLTAVPFMRGLWWDGVPHAWNLPGWLESTMTAGWVIALIVASVWLIVMFARRDPERAAPPETPPQRDPWTSDASIPKPSAPSATFSPSSPPGQTPVSPGATAPVSLAKVASPPGDQDATIPLAGATPTTVWDGAPSQQRGWTSQEFRDEMNRQRAEQQAERETKARERRAQHPGAAFVAITLGLALLAGAGAAVVAASAGFSIPVVVVIGLATALGALAVATIIAGISGRESGWLGHFTWATVISLLATGVFPLGSSFLPVGRATWTVTSTDADDRRGYVMIAGQPTLDLGELADDDALRGGTIDVWIIAGEVDVLIPEDVPVIVEFSAIAGTLDTGRGDRDGTDRRGGALFQDEARYGRTTSADTTRVRVWTVAGSAVVTEEAEAGR